MADIDIQKKQGPNPLPWIVGLVVLVLVAWGIYALVNRDDEPAVATTEAREDVAPADPAAAPPAQPAEPTAGARFQAWVRDSAEAVDQMGLEHEYTREGIRRLAAAIEDLTRRDQTPEVDQHVQRMRTQVQQIEQSDPASVQHANQARAAFMSGVEALEALRQRPHLQGADLQQPLQSARSAAESMDPATPLLEQRGTVHTYFDSMGNAIERAERHQQLR